jgi:hypothetical protein
LSEEQVGSPNGAINHELELSDIPWTFCRLKLNTKEGFYWAGHGLYDLDDQEIAVPDETETKTS